MDVLFHLFLRMALWLRQPPSRQHVWVMVIVVGIAAFCVVFQGLFGWPEWLTVQRQPRTFLMRP